VRGDTGPVPRCKLSGYPFEVRTPNGESRLGALFGILMYIVDGLVGIWKGYNVRVCNNE
jgi:hypothetical protein